MGKTGSVAEATELGLTRTHGFVNNTTKRISFIGLPLRVFSGDSYTLSLFFL